MKSGLYVAIKIQVLPAEGPNRLKNQYDMLREASSSDYVPNVFAFVDDLQLGIPPKVCFI